MNDDMDDTKSDDSFVVGTAPGSEASSGDEQDEEKIDNEEVEVVQGGKKSFREYLEQGRKATG
ncbi:hypothetical protein CTA2_8514 [Colletotrichum tanaceti]|uniref:Uncharacterized protein n=1 Tax=Colletotrichum tanaceti TaxID=1306861 RepID=A0A4V6DFN5_9PEZI|nr:hypothetical protein CTA2_8514 [Colletotrichum tanaceti]TKW49796.1 hypothetical protein CTA1_4397 [Colletotrichum tanaceti]